MSQTSTHNSYQLNSSDSDAITSSNEDEVELIESNISNVLETSQSLDVESNSSSPDQSTSHSRGVTVTNSLGKRIQRRKVPTRTKKSRSRKSWVWHYFKKNKVEKKAYCQVKITNEDGSENKCNHDYELSTGTGNLKSHLRQALNSYVGRDKYREKLLKLQAELNPEHLVNPLSSDTQTRWNSTYNLLNNLLLLRYAIMRLASDLKQSVNRQERQDGTKLSELLLSAEEWNSLDELSKLLHPFAQATGYIGGSQYPTLGMMIPTLIKLSRHLQDFYPRITSSIVKA
ncbi:14784_t:CDS:2, partial [Dentiscutata heterogama]